MIKKILILAVASMLSATLPVCGASVTPSSATNYIFTTPLFPASIRGEVMGDPPAYYDPRGEDVDWMFEAYEERIALIYGSMRPQTTHLVPSFGEWPLSYTNRFYVWSTAVDASGATNVVVGYSLVTNAPQFSLYFQDVVMLYGMLRYVLPSGTLGYDTGAYANYRSKYLDGAELLLTEARACYDTDHAPLFTNVTFSVGYTNAVVTNVTTISMPMTNGTTSVFTNMWIATLEIQATNAVTNVVEACPLDYCHESEGPFPGLTNSPAVIAAIRWPFRNGVTAQMYGELRSAVRLADTTSPTNSEKYVYYSRYKYSDEYGSTITTDRTTNSQTTAEYSISGTSNYTADWNEERQEYDLYYGYSVNEVKTFQYEAVAPTRFHSDVVTTGGVVRVEIKAAYAVVEFSYRKAHLEGEVPNTHFVTDTSTNKVVVVPLEIYSLDLSQPDAIARVRLDAKSLCGEAAAAAGAPSPPEDAEEYEPPNDEAHHWSAECSSVVLIYKINPSSKFDDW